jgi:alpha-D-xyloside xylohydrolase
MGYPVWASDIGGYWGQFNRETCMRWLGFGCFAPIMEIGPTLNRGFWNMVEEPVLDKELIATWRMYAVIRMRLVPYIHSLAVQARETGTPIVRPLFLEYPEQEEAWKEWHTFLLGNDLLVSVIWEQGKTGQKIYLPRGETWINAWNPEEEIRGGRFITVNAPLHQTPLYIRKGADHIDLGDLNALWEESLDKAAQSFSLSELEKKEEW